MADHAQQQSQKADSTLPERQHFELSPVTATSADVGDNSSSNSWQDELLASLLLGPTHDPQSCHPVRGRAVPARPLVRTVSMDASAESGGWRPAAYAQRRQSFDAQKQRHEEQMTGIQDQVTVGPGFSEK